jgi:hypothetical protein
LGETPFPKKYFKGFKTLKNKHVRKHEEEQKIIMYIASYI